MTKWFCKLKVKQLPTFAVYGNANGFGLVDWYSLHRLDVFTCLPDNPRWKPIDSVDSLKTSSVHQVDFTGVANLKLVTTSHDRHLRGSHQLAIAFQSA